MTIGEKISLRRRTAGLSQEALAAQLGVSRQAVSRWETSESLPDTEKVLQLCRMALAGLTGAVSWALRMDQWYYDIGRIGTALLYHWMGPIVAGGGCLMILALFLLIFDVLLSWRD